MGVSNNNLIHVLADNCKDPDCELHNIDVAIGEEVVDDTNVAFFLAGAQALRDLMTHGGFDLNTAMHNVRALIIDRKD